MAGRGVHGAVICERLLGPHPCTRPSAWALDTSLLRRSGGERVLHYWPGAGKKGVPNTLGSNSLVGYTRSESKSLSMRAVPLEAFSLQLACLPMGRNDLLARFPFLADRLQTTGSFHGPAPAPIAQDTAAASLQAKLMERVEVLSAEIIQELKLDRVLRIEELDGDRELRKTEHEIWSKQLEEGRALLAGTLKAVEMYADIQVEELALHGEKMACILAELRDEFKTELAAVSSRLREYEATAVSQGKMITVLAKAVMTMQGDMCSDLLKQIAVTGDPKEPENGTTDQDNTMTEVSAICQPQLCRSY